MTRAAGALTSNCERCGKTVGLGALPVIPKAHGYTAVQYERDARLSALCGQCGAPASAIVPLTLFDDASADVILAQPAGRSQRVPAGVVHHLLMDILEALPEPATATVRVYADREHYFLWLKRPELFGSWALTKVFAPEMSEEATLLEDLTNDLMQVGYPYYALTVFVRTAHALPELLQIAIIVENIQLLTAVVEDNAEDGDALVSRAQELVSDVATSPDASLHTVRWLVPYAFGPEAPQFNGVPAGYLVPSTYVEPPALDPAGRARASLSLLMGSSVLMSSGARESTEGEPIHHRELRHESIIRLFVTSWRALSHADRDEVAAIYHRATRRSLVQDLGSRLR